MKPGDLVTVRKPTVPWIVDQPLHDMPYQDGRKWARWLTENWEKKPVVITSTTGLEGVREEMLETLRKGGFKAIINPADHAGCEIEWLSWMKGALA